MPQYNFTHSIPRTNNVFNVAYHNERPLLYSFKFFNIDKNQKKYYKSTSRTKEDFYQFLCGCQKICGMTWRELRQDSQFHCHDIDNGFKFTDPELEGWPPIQIRLPGMKQGRLVGFIDEKFVFNVVKYDKDHIIYPDKSR